MHKLDDFSFLPEDFILCGIDVMDLYPISLLIHLWKKLSVQFMETLLQSTLKKKVKKRLDPIDQNTSLITIRLTNGLQHLIFIRNY